MSGLNSGWIDKQVESLWTEIKVQTKTGDVVGACSKPSHQQEKADEAILGEVERAIRKRH